MAAASLEGTWGWTGTSQCWRCSKGRQSRVHLLKECTTWAKEIRVLWRKVEEASGRRSEGHCLGEQEMVRPSCQAGKGEAQ